MTSRADGIAITYTPARGPPTRVRFEPRSDGRWERDVAVWTGCGHWRPTGREIVTDMTLDAPKAQSDTLTDTQP